MINNPIIYKFFKDFANHRKKNNRAEDLAVDLSPTFLNTGTTDETFQQSGKQDSFRHILKSSASMYEISGSQFVRTTTGIQSGPGTCVHHPESYENIIKFQISSRKENR